MCWQVARQLQLHCLSRLNPFIPCVCVFTYLSLSIIFLADMSSWMYYSSRPCCTCRCKLMHVSTSIYWNTQIISGRTLILGTRVRQTRGKWYIDIYHYSARGGCCNVGLAQARPNNLWQNIWSRIHTNALPSDQSIISTSLSSDLATCTCLIIHVCMCGRFMHWSYQFAYVLINKLAFDWGLTAWKFPVSVTYCSL